MCNSETRPDNQEKEFIQLNSTNKQSMHVFSIPPLQAELISNLSRVVGSKYCNEEQILDWGSSILPSIISRLDTLEDIANNQESKELEKNNEANQIRNINRKIAKHLHGVFSSKPPFTILRIAELLLDPTKEGYDLTSTRHMLKYFNSLSKVVIVSSASTDYPPTTFKSKDQPDITSQIAFNVPLVEIPWLHASEAVTGNVKDSLKSSHLEVQVSDSMIISPPRPEDLTDDTLPEMDSKRSEIASSPTRRRKGNEYEGLDILEGNITEQKKSKRPNTNIVNPLTSEKKQLLSDIVKDTEHVKDNVHDGSKEDEEDEKMDISNSTLEDLSTSISPDVNPKYSDFESEKCKANEAGTSSEDCMDIITDNQGELEVEIRES